MQKIGDITPTADANGEWTNGSVAGGTPPTIIDAAWLNTVQRELINVLKAAGITPDPTKDNQVITALAGYFLQAANNLSEIKTAGATAQGAARTNIGAAAVAGLVAQVFSVAPATLATHAPQACQMTGRNRLINPRFVVNQRSYASGATLALSSYGMDGWKASTAGSSMTFSALPAGQQVTIAGSFLQIVLAYDIEPGTYTLSWAGTSQARVYNVGASAPSYASSPITVAVSGGVNVNVEFNAGTLFTPQLEIGGVATTPERRLYQQEFALCQQRLFGLNLAGAQAVYGGAGTYISLSVYAPVSLRTNTSISLGSTSMTINQPGVGTAFTTTATPTAVGATSNMIAFNISGNWSGLSNGAPVIISSAAGITLFSSEP